MATQYGEAVTASVMRQFSDDRTQHGGLRLSSLGKPAVLQAIEIPTVKAELVDAGLYVTEQISMRMRELFHRGDQYEAFVLCVLQMSGWTIETTQQTVEFLGVTGHTDAVVVSPTGERVLLEVKTMSDTYYKAFTKRQNDDRGYITQLATYTHCVGLPSLWLCFNKSTHDVAIIKPVLSQFTEALARAATIIPLLTERINCFDDVGKHLSPPPPVPEVYRKHQTGRSLLHPSIKYSQHRHLFYNILVEDNGYGKPTEYVTGYSQTL